ncbi:fasciclin domain-containing protein [Daejeonella lutea]|uniref:Uncaracterized surface protein containing fasciclin (FAS1) repeats n=1 Tax=Daejeonella lutea TaxID=572036 RepID=A0A1T5A570_9SPHI|nr:fasciclin domain-containing protein [Daejeonella lutea]SKB29897.1 Uncaracterized surface protein containing fasciclin (FAS1) repeats [Daejeonella lutea]
MKSILKLTLTAVCGIALSCNSGPAAVVTNESLDSHSGQSGVQDDLSQKNVVQVAAGSKDHTTLVKAVQAAELVDALSNAGPFTVFAPTNAAFEKLPAGTVEGLLAPEKKDNLADILQYHVSLGVFKSESLMDGQVLGQVNGRNVTVSKKDGKILLNGSATIVASVPASNGIIHTVDGVLLPPANK